MNVTVLKLGGSLCTSPLLEEWLAAITVFARQRDVIVVPGGGAYADLVRVQQQHQGFDDLTAHRQALLAMCQTGYWLMEKCPALKPINDSDKVSSQLGQGVPLLWLPLELLDDTSIPASWDFTSDSIALWLAGKLKAPHMLLLKMRTLDAETGLTDYINKGLIDKGFQLLIGSIKSKIYIFSGENYADLCHPQAWPPALVCAPRH